MDEYLGMIKIFMGTYAPKDWALCNGQILPIRSFTALFSLLGTTYGGDGVTTFALPNLQAQAPLGFGQGNGLDRDRHERRLDLRFGRDHRAVRCGSVHGRLRRRAARPG